MSEIVQFPGAEAPSSDKVHAKAFRDLEGQVCDLERMGDIAQQLIMECAATEDSFRQLELAVFAVQQLQKMTRDFRSNYYDRWHGEQVITS